MKLDFFIQPLDVGGYRASNSTLGVILEAPTREATILKIENWIRQQANKGCELVSIEIPKVEHP